MRTIKAVPITVENFQAYGSFTKVLEPSGYNLGEFYPDRCHFPVNGRVPITFSPLVTYKPEQYIVDEAEYHDYTCEGVIPMDDDVVLHVAPASPGPVPELTEAFIVPKGTAVRLNPGVWHKAALPVNNDVCHVLIVLPERTYHNDCVVVGYADEDKVLIEL